MKQIYLKSLLLMLMMCVGMGAWGEEATWTASEAGYGNAASVSNVVLNSNISLEFEKGTNSSNTPKYYNSGTAVRAYGGNTITLNATNATITGVTFTFGSDDGSNAIAANVGSFTSPNWAGSANAVTFTIGGTTGNRRISAIKVTYATSGGGSTETPTNYTITVANNIANGSVTASSTSAAKDAEITLTATPDAGYEFGSWNVTNASTSEAITVTNNKFTMPAANVNVSATFKEIQGDEPSGEGTTVSMTSFSAISGNVGGDANVSYGASKGSASTAPAVNSNEIRVYQNGGIFTITAATGYKLKSVTIGSSMATSINYKLDGGDEALSSNASVSANGTYTASNLDNTSIQFICKGTTSSSRLYVNSLSVTYVEDVSIAYNTVTWSVNGIATSIKVAEGNSIDFRNPETTLIKGKRFIGWTTTEIDGTTNGAPNFVTSATMGDEDVTYYAVFADEDGAVTFDAKGLKYIGSYEKGSNIDSKGKVWNFYATINQIYGTSYFGLNSNEKNYNIASPKFPANVKSISIKAYNGSSDYDRRLYLCSNDVTAQPTTGDLGDVTILKSEKFENVYSFDLNNSKDFNQFYIYAPAALGISEIRVVYSTVEYSNYCTTVPEALPASISSAGYATFVPSTSVTVPSGVTAYAVKIDGDKAKLTPVPAIPANMAVVLKGGEGTYYFPETTEKISYVASDLKASNANVKADGTQYILANGEDGIGFYKATPETTIAAGKAYLEISGTSVKSITFEEVTAIDAVATTDAKVANYNLRGQRVSADYKGIVIKNGKKYLNK